MKKKKSFLFDFYVNTPENEVFVFLLETYPFGLEPRRSRERDTLKNHLSLHCS